MTNPSQPYYIYGYILHIWIHSGYILTVINGLQTTHLINTNRLIVWKKKYIYTQAYNYIILDINKICFNAFYA